MKKFQLFFIGGIFEKKKCTYVSEHSRNFLENMLLSRGKDRGRGRTYPAKLTLISLNKLEIDHFMYKKKCGCK